jgi:alpha-amylase/alpha-mannosidase (GH57 family)
MAAARVHLLLLWHMHQPDYRDRDSGEFTLPWAYLHAIKDYTDMAAHLERHPGVRAAVNFVPVLLDQIEDYAGQFARGELRDPLLRLLQHPDLGALAAEERRLILETCFRGNHQTMVAPFPRYRRLLDVFRLLEGGNEFSLDYLSGTYFGDLLTWYHLAWMGETERRSRPLVAELMARGEGYTHADRMRLAALIGKLIRDIVPRYRALAEAGRIELSTTPYSHPLAPLLIDFAAARESEPNAVLPQSQCYPGGRTRVAKQLKEARASHAARFGAAPAGIWPAEGALSTALVEMFAQQDVAWTASSESVLAHSVHGTGEQTVRAPDLYRPYRLAGAPQVAIFFRDERLSDMIGFEYAKWHSGDAARNLIAQIEAIGRAAEGPDTPLVTLILDGENAWEYYPYNAYYFFSELYGLLESHPTIRTVTPTAYLAQPAAQPGELKRLVAGSWVYGTLSTWIGDPEKNRAWDMLCAAKQSYDLVLSSGRLSVEEPAQAESQLRICEGSDWFWWLGAYNPPHTVASFERLFRRNLARLYAALKLPPPAQLQEVLSRGAGAPELGGTIRRAR